MNILLIGNDERVKLLAELCKKSNKIDKIYTTAEFNIEDVPNITYLNYDELIQKAKLIQADLSITFDEKYINDDLQILFKNNKLNILCTNKKWLNLEKSKLIAKQLMNHYSVNNPRLIKAPTKFPVVLKRDSSENNEKIFANSIDELIAQRKKLINKNDNEKIFIEEFLEGEEFSLISLWDGQNILFFQIQNLTEVQLERLDILKTKLNFMFSDEKTDFAGFIVTKLLWAKNEWYVLEFKMQLEQDDLINLINTTDLDFGYILDALIYQNLDEIKL